MGRVKRRRCKRCLKRTKLSHLKYIDGFYYHADCAKKASDTFAGALELARAQFYDEHVNGPVGTAVANLISVQSWLITSLHHDKQDDDMAIYTAIEKALKELTSVQLPTRTPKGEVTGQWMPTVPTP